jgi:poly(3-hydroxybutyrate) depolymerase
VVVQSGGTRAQASSSGGTSATVTTKASGGSSPNATTTVTDAAPSEGCGAAATLSSGAGSITVSGTSREYVLKLPSNYDPQHPYRLIFAFHGRQYTAQSVADGGPPGSGPFYGIESAANGSAIFVAPQALSSSWSNDSDRDVEFVTAMLSLFESKLCIDKNRVFSTGFSMGAIMTIALGCEKADVFRAIAPMSGKVQGTCTGTHAIAYWASHGNSDTTILPKEGEAARDVFVTRDGCSKQTSAGAPQGCVNYVGCDAKYPVTWCTFDGEHEPAPFAGTAIWTFLSQF